MSPSAFMRADRVEAELLSRVLERARHYQETRDRNLAKMIVSELGAALKRRGR